MDNTILMTIFRTALILSILFLLAKVMGKKQISQLNIFDYTIGITMGSIAADISLDIEKNLIAGIISLAIYGFASAIISLWSLKSITARRIFYGIPTILMEKGKIIEGGLRKNKLNLNELQEEARSCGYFDLSEIDCAVMESTGKVSFLLKEENKPVTKKDMDVKCNKDGLVANIIIDEEIMITNLKVMNKTEKWLKQQLKVLGYDGSKGILLATLDNNDKLIIYKKGVKSEKSTVLE